jgi:hypothetical protein
MLQDMAAEAAGILRTAVPVWAPPLVGLVPFK